MARLSHKTARNLPSDVEKPGYTPTGHGVGIVHLGIGAFHRAHQAAYVDKLLALEGGDWRIRGVSLRSPDVRDRLQPQDALYMLAERNADGERLRLVGSIAEVLVASENPAAVVSAIADPGVKIVSLTITEKGYCHDPSSGELDESHPDIEHDLANANQPRTALGFLAAGLARRHAAGTPAPTLLCCDNLPENGRVLARVLTRFAALQDDGLAAWIEANVAFPATMVDRIVPATTDSDIAHLAARTGVEDRAMVKTEPFSQWVIEDSFAGPRPAFERVGVQMVTDVRPFELAKLRMLNGSHSTLAYLGLRLGYDFVHEAIGDPDIRAIVEQLTRAEAAPTLPAEPALNPARYASALLERFANPALGHRLMQIAMDGSQKLPQRLLGTIRDRLSRDGTADAALLGVAAWMLHATGRGPDGASHPVDDPMATSLAAAAARAGGDPAKLVREMLGIAAIFGDLSDVPGVARMVTDHVVGLLRSPRDRVRLIAAQLTEGAAA